MWRSATFNGRARPSVELAALRNVGEDAASRGGITLTSTPPRETAFLSLANRRARVIELVRNMSDYVNLPCRDAHGHFHVVVESPRGSMVKLKYEVGIAAFVFKRSLQLGASYPYDWGFVPSTRAPDGDPLDAMLLFEAPTWPGVVIPAKAIGVVRLVQREKGKKKERNDRIIALPVEDPRYDDVKDLPKRVRRELEQFFVTITEMTDKEVSVEGWEGPAAAEDVIEKAVQTYVRRGA
jgi:inorganic pyrophosphatase